MFKSHPTASRLTRPLRPPKVPLSSLRSDGFANLLGGLIISGTFPTLPEVGLFFNGIVWRGNRTRKISNEGFDAFEGEGGGIGALITGEYKKRRHQQRMVVMRAKVQLGGRRRSDKGRGLRGKEVK